MRWRWRLVVCVVVLAVVAWWLNRVDSGEVPDVAVSKVSAPAPATAAPSQAPVNASIATQKSSPGAFSRKPMVAAFVDRRAQLEQRARAGDAVAAYELGSVMAHCAGYAPTDPQELEQVVVSGMAAGVDAPVLGGEPVSPELLLLLLQHTASNLAERCSGANAGVDVQDRREALDWLARAADSGDGEAMLEYAEFAFNDYDSVNDLLLAADEVQARKQRARTYLSRALATGHARALAVLAQEYSTGRLMPQNPVEAYAHFYAFSRTGHAAGWDPRLRDLFLQALARPLEPGQIALAQTHAQTLLRDCCGGGAAR